MTKFFRDRDPFIMVLVIACIVAAMAIAVLAISKGIEMWQQSGVVPTPSYYVRNLEALKRAQPDDILTCIGGGDGIHPVFRHAVLIENNYQEYVRGQDLNYHAVGPMRKYYPTVFDGCEVRILRPSKTRVATDTLASIILYGLNPPTTPDKPVN